MDLQQSHQYQNKKVTPPVNLSDLLAKARSAALEAGSAIMAIYNSGEFNVVTKPDDSPLTQADRAAHDIISHHLSATALPILSEEGAQVAYEERAKWSWFWLVDPLDGTKEFMKRNGEFTVNIALMHNNAPVAGVVYAPCLNTLYYGAKETGVYEEEGENKTQLPPLQNRTSISDLLQKPEVTVVASRSHLTPETENFMKQFKSVQRISMGSSLKMMLLAEGKADIYPRFAPTMEWDTAASHAILNALNRSIYQEDLQTELTYNKQNMLNPFFVCF